MYYWRDGYDSFETNPGEGYYDNFAREGYDIDLQDNFGFKIALVIMMMATLNTTTITMVPQKAPFM